LDGIKNGSEPPEPTEGNVYKFDDTSLSNIDILPTSLPEALNELKKNGMIKEVLGGQLFEKYIGIKTKEWGESKVQVTQWELDKYLNIY
jgi:Glutamine synthetase